MNLDSSLKVIVVGDSGVGKSSIVARFCGEKFNPVYIQTKEKDIKKKDLNLEDRKIARLQIWDTPGIESLRTITAAYMKDVKGVVVVFDVTSEESFDNVQHWMRTVQEFSNTESLSIVIVGNKKDGERKVTEESCENLARNNYNVHYFETSAKTSENQIIDKVFREIAKDIFQKSQTLEPKAMQSPAPDPELVKQEKRSWCPLL